MGASNCSREGLWTAGAGLGRIAACSSAVRARARPRTFGSRPAPYRGRLDPIASSGGLPVPRHPVDAAVARYAAQQHGAFNRQQVFASGGTDALIHRRRRSGAWLPLATAVYGLPGYPETWHRSLIVAVLSVPQAVVSGRAAAALHGLTGFRPCRPEITVPSGANHRSPSAIVHRSNLVVGTHRAGIPVVTIPQTLLELAMRGVSARRIEIALDDALAAGLTSIEAVGQRYADLAPSRLPHLGLIRSMLEARGDGHVAPASELERLLYAMLDHPAIPPHERQASFPWRPHDDDRVDALIPSWRLIVEGDGRRWHARYRDLERDRHRDQQAVAHGYRVLRFGWVDLRDSPDACLEIVLAAGGRSSQLGARLVAGWYVA